MTTHLRSLGYLVPLATSLTLSACSDPAAVLIQDTDAGDTTIELSVGQELDVMLGTVGPGAYDSLPDISSNAIRFLDAAIVPPYLPAGPRQRFRFTGKQSGQAVITFHHSGTTPDVIRTVHVR